MVVGQNNAIKNKGPSNNERNKETVAELPGLCSACKVKECQGLLTACSVRFTPQLQRQTRTDLRWRPHAVDTLLPLAIAPVAPFHGIRSCGQQLGIQKRQGLVQGGGKALRERRAHLGEPQEPTAPFGQVGQRRLGPTAPIKQSGDLGHEHTQPVDVGPPTGEAPQQRAGGFAHVPLEAQLPLAAQRRALRCQPLGRAGGLLCRWRTRAPAAPCGVCGCPALAGASDGTSDGCADLGHEMQRTAVRPHRPAPLPEGCRRERRALGGDTAAGQVACRHSRCESPEQRPDVLVGGSVSQDVREEPFVAAILHCRPQAAGAILHCIGGDIARQIRQGPGKAVRVPARRRLFFPSLAPGLHGRQGDKDAVVAPEGPTCWPVGQSVLAHEPDRPSNHAVGIVTAWWRQLGEVRVQGRAALRTGGLRIRDHALPPPPEVEMPQVGQCPRVLLVPIGLGPTTRTRLARGGAPGRDDLWRWQVGNRAHPFGGIGSIRPRTELGCVLRARMVRPALYDKRPSGARPKPGKDAIVSE